MARSSADLDLAPLTDAEATRILTMRFALRGRGADGHLDCLGLVLYAFGLRGIALPDPIDYDWSPTALSDFFAIVPAAHARAWDVLYWETGDGIHGRHVGLVEGADSVIETHAEIGKVYRRALRDALRDGPLVYRYVGGVAL